MGDDRPGRGEPSRPRRRAAGPARLAALAIAAAVLAGCFDAPKLEDRWTRVDLDGANLTAYQALPLGAPESVAVDVRVTYRRILTGYAVAELRVGPAVVPGQLPIDPDASRLPMAQAIDSLLDHSVTIGRATRAVTGWDHLIQPLSFRFSATVPAVLDSTNAASGTVFLLCYLGSGDVVRRLGQADTVIVTPFKSAAYEVLPVGMTFRTAAAGTP